MGDAEPVPGEPGAEGDGDPESSGTGCSLLQYIRSVMFIYDQDCMVTIEFTYMRLVLYLLLVLVQHGHIPILLPTHFAGQEEAGPVRVVTAPPHM